MDPSPPNEVDVSCARLEPPPWLERVAPFCLRVLERLGIRGWELSVLLCGDPFMQELNRRYRGMDAPTDVLSFGREEGEEGRLAERGPSATWSFRRPRWRATRPRRAFRRTRS